MKPDTLQFRRRESVPHGFARISHLLIANSLACVRKPPAQLAEAIHQIRRNIKRLRALLRLIRELIEETGYRRLNARLRKAAHHLAGSRDQTVALATIQKLAAKARSHRERSALQHFAASFRTPGATKARSRQAHVLKQAGRDLHAAEKSLQHLTFARQNEDVQGILKSYRRARAGLIRAKKGKRTGDFHEWRKRVKNLHHQLSLLADTCPNRIQPMDRKLKKLGDQLGKLQDLAIVRQFLTRKVARSASQKDARLIKGRLDRECTRLRQKTLRKGKCLFAEKPGKFIRQNL